MTHAEDIFNDAAKTRSEPFALRLKFRRPNNPTNGKLNFWYRVIIITTSIMPAFVILVILGMLNDMLLKPWMVVVVSIISVVPLSLGELLRRAVCEKIVSAKSQSVEIAVSRKGLHFSAEDFNYLEEALSQKEKRSNYLYEHILKRVFDIVASSVILFSLLPLMAAISIIIKLEDGGPPFCKSKRIGQNGKTFSVLKFRTMYTDADERMHQKLSSDPKARNEWVTTRKLTQDPRVTKLGKFLRKTSMDELPQIFSVLKGDMSLVGPGPISIEEAYNYTDTGYFDIKPGIFGYWQIAEKSNLPYGAKKQLDSAYRSSIRFRTDLIIIVRAIAKLFSSTDMN